MGLFFKSKERATGKRIEKIRDKFLFTGQSQDAVDSLTKSPRDSFSMALETAQYDSTASLRKRLKETPSNPENIGYLVEYLHREKIDPEIAAKYKDVDFKPYFEFIKKKSKLYDEANKKIFYSNLAAFGTSLGMSYLLRLMVEDPPKEEVKNFVDFIKNKDNLKTSLQFTNSPLKSYFDPTKNLVNTGTDLAIASHEFGHATNYASKIRRYGEKAGKALSFAQYAALENIPFVSLFSRKLGPIAQVPFMGLAVAPLAHNKVTNAIKGNNPGSLRYKAGTEIEEHPMTIGALAVSPKLYEEASATARGLSNIAKYKDFKTALRSSPKLLAALSTYAAAAAIPIASMYAINRTSKLNKDVDSYKLLGDK